jgi:hypothetical protein
MFSGSMIEGVVGVQAHHDRADINNGVGAKRASSVALVMVAWMESVSPTWTVLLTLGMRVLPVRSTTARDSPDLPAGHGESLG